MCTKRIEERKAIDCVDMEYVWAFERICYDNNFYNENWIEWEEKIPKCSRLNVSCQAKYWTDFFSPSIAPHSLLFSIIFSFSIRNSFYKNAVLAFMLDIFSILCVDSVRWKGFV